ncbi:MAG: helix-turn-helix transcriptional regulator [Bacteroidales bacterium]|jgi:transcriptional regulator with XRE-family HTH domain|nr:helix-turn-helix transcriptional regulator [Bacteroidales bacterium]
MGYYSDQEQRGIIADNLTRFISLSQKDQKDVAIDLDINPPTFNQWVNGKAIPNISTLRKVAEYFNVGLSDIIDKYTDSDSNHNINPTTYELKMISAYRASTSGIKEAVTKLLNV